MQKARPAKGRTSEQSRQRLLEVATREFASHGLAGARVDEIAAAAKVNKQLVYYHFGSKDELYSAVLTEGFTRARAADVNFLNLIDDPVAAVCALIRDLALFNFEQREFCVIVAGANLERAKHIRKSGPIQKSYEALISGLDQTLDRGRKLGIFHSSVSATDLFISIVGLLTVRVTNARTFSAVLPERPVIDDLEHTVDHVTKFVMAALRFQETKP